MVNMNDRLHCQFSNALASKNDFTLAEILIEHNQFFTKFHYDIKTTALQYKRKYSNTLIFFQLKCLTQVYQSNQKSIYCRFCHAFLY